jgi:hypothetical protein
VEINEAAKQIRTTAMLHGWEESERPMGDWIALAHSELSEAFEIYRNNHLEEEIWYDEKGKPEGILVELADCIIRCLHHMQWITDSALAAGVKDESLTPAGIIEEKMKYNETRPYRHGGKRA